MIPVIRILFVIGMVFATMGIYGFFLKERSRKFSNPFIQRCIQKAEYGKILSSACVTAAVFIWFLTVPYSAWNLLILIACVFTFPGDFILSRDLTKLLIAIPLFAVAYTLMSVRGLAEVALAPVNPVAVGSCVVTSIGAIVAFLGIYGRKLTPPAFKIAAFVYSVIDWLLLFAGISMAVQTIAVVPGIGMILLVIGDMIAVVNIVKPFRNKPVFNLFGGIIYFVGLYAVVVYFTI